MRLALICETLEDGRRFLEANEAAADVVLVSVRSPNSIRGRTVDAVFATPAARRHKRYLDAVEVTAPAACTSKWAAVA